MKNNNNTNKKKEDLYKKKNRDTLAIVIGALVFMLALSFASVPLYKAFCQATGYGGTPKIAFAPSGKIIEDRELTIYFTADTHRDLPWEFKESQYKIKVKVGEMGLAFYKFKNPTKRSIIGIASYNVTPLKAAKYFNKMECFCFEEQILDAGNDMEMPVQFFIDPEFVNDPNMKDVNHITLSYTFFEAKDFKWPGGISNIDLPQNNHAKRLEIINKALNEQ